MRPIYLNLNPAVVGYISDPIVLDQYTNSSKVIVTYSLSNASTITATLEFTTSDVFNSNAVIIWQAYTAPPFNTQAAVSLTGPAAAEAVFEFVPRAVRTRVTAATNSPNFSVEVIQLGLTGA